MDKWIYNVVVNNIGKGKIAESDAEIYEYGYTLMIEKLIIFVVSVVIALILDAIWEVLALCITFIPLRIYSGGYHAKSRWWCMVLSGTFLMLGVVGVSVLPQLVNAIAYLFVEVVCIFFTIRFAPIGTKQRQITVSEKSYYKTRLIVVVCFELLIGLVCVYLGMCTMAMSIIISNICNMLSVLGQVYCNNFIGKIAKEKRVCCYSNCMLYESCTYEFIK